MASKSFTNISFNEKNVTSMDSRLVYAAGDVISSETRQLVETICFAGLTSFICVISVPANVINCLVFWRQGLRERMNLCLCCLALVDCLYLTCTLTVKSVSALMMLHDEFLSQDYSSHLFIYLGGVTYGLRTMSHFITMVIAVERCVCVVYPFKAASLLTSRTMGALMLSCFIVFQGCYLLLPFSYSVFKVVGNDGELKWIVAGPTQFFRDHERLIYTVTYIALGTIVPITTLLVVCISTIITVIYLKAAITWREITSSSDSRSQQVALAKMLVIVSCVYVITVTPLVARQSSLWAVQTCLFDETCYELFLLLSAIAYTMSYSSSCVNTVIYYTRSSRFRQELHNILCDVSRPTGRRPQKTWRL